MLVVEARLAEILVEDFEGFVRRQLRDSDFVEKHEPHFVRLTGAGGLLEDARDALLVALLGPLVLEDVDHRKPVHETALRALDLLLGERVLQNAHGHGLRGPRLPADEERNPREDAHEHRKQVFLERSVDGDVSGDLPETLATLDHESLLLLDELVHLLDFREDVELEIHFSHLLEDDGFESLLEIFLVKPRGSAYRR